MEKESKDLTVPNEDKLTVQGFLNAQKVRSYLDSVLKERSGQFIANLVSLVNLDFKLQKCEPRSLMMCGLKATALNLPLDNNLGFAYAIPYGNQCQFQMGYRGFIQLAMRTGLYRSINVIDIREEECISWNALTENLELKLIDDDKEREKLPIVGYAAMFELTNGFRKTIFKKKDVLLAHGKRFSKAFSSGPWKSDTDAMCRKTLVKELLHRWGPLSTEIMEGIKADQAVIKATPEGEVYEYLDHGEEDEPVDYGLPEDCLSILIQYFEALGMNEAERSMKLAACKGNIEAAEKLKEELTAEIQKKGQERDLFEKGKKK